MYTRLSDPVALILILNDDPQSFTRIKKKKNWPRGLLSHKPLSGDMVDLLHNILQMHNIPVF